MQWAWRQEAPTQHKFTLVALADYADDSGHCWPSQAGLAEKVNRSTRQVRESLAWLEKNSLVVRRKRHGKERLTDICQLAMWRNSVSQAEDIDSQAEEYGKAKRRPASTEPSIKEPSIEPSVKSTVVLDIFNHWKKAMGKNGHSKLTPERKRLIQSRLADDYSAEQIKQAVDNVAASEWHMGTNDRSTAYNDLTLICRSGSKLESYIDLGKEAQRERRTDYDRAIKN